MALSPLLNAVVGSIPNVEDDGSLHVLSTRELQRAIQQYRRAIAAVEGPVTFSGIPADTSTRLLQQLKHTLSKLERESARRDAPEQHHS